MDDTNFFNFVYFYKYKDIFINIKEISFLLIEEIIKKMYKMQTFVTLL